MFSMPCDLDFQSADTCSNVEPCLKVEDVDTEKASARLLNGVEQEKPSALDALTGIEDDDDMGKLLAVEGVNTPLIMTTDLRQAGI